MKRIIASVIALSALTAPALSLDDAGFQAAALKCWNTPVSFDDAGKFEMAVEIDQKGHPIDITAKSYVQNGVSRGFGETLKRSIMRCAPYKFPAGIYTMTLNAKKGGKSLNPFKD
ncbi:hypothetical protein [Brucella pseudogrignonensis]|uniref:Uncharacterized protein n=1 Tax=Brucella pseudogrignonensis TaxID=419475 RepID=A0A256G3I3_9HYPH|nr:hypothetical protein [Brucella pseudogrignonensis]OYR21642.1 hypothetical protein CEV34_4816 [Brucella pseudogrignonensis]